jgi:hypothetical protein
MGARPTSLGDRSWTARCTGVATVCKRCSARMGTDIYGSVRNGEMAQCHPASVSEGLAAVRTFRRRRRTDDG